MRIVIHTPVGLFVGADSKDNNHDHARFWIDAVSDKSGFTMDTDTGVVHIPHTVMQVAVVEITMTPNAKVTGRQAADGGESDELGEHDGS